MAESVEETAGPAGARSPGNTPAPEGGYPAARLRLLHDEAPTGPDRRAALARLTDDWLAGLLARHGAAAGLSGTALVAVGGYGRGELSPRSDLDLLLLHDGRAEAGALATLADHLWYPVWDLGLALDHSVRTPAEARKAAREDLKVQLGLLDARHLAGDPDLTAALRTTAYADWRESAPKRLPELHDLCQERAERQGELQYLLEPDLKEARGGLRDATALRAVAASWLADAPRGGLEAARTRLLDARDALHLTTGRATDRLSLQEQDQVATALGMLDADALLRQTYESARTISYAADVTWREVGRVLRARSLKPMLRGLLHGRTAGKGERSPLAEGVVELDGEAVLARTARPERDPVLVLRAAAAAAQAGLPLATHAIRRCATATAAKPLPVPWPAEAREQLVTLLGAGTHTVPVWEALEAEGIITRLLPDWERVRCRPQRNPVHTWTVDRHLVETAVRASALTRRVHRPDLLLVAALLHDIGKGWPGDHSVAGETIARDVAARLGFDARDTTVIATLVRHHLLLIETATRRDLDDPATVGAVAEAVGSTRTLELLHALTEADALATGPAAWSAWRGGLVADLVKRVAARLAGEPDTEVRGAGEPTAEQERLAIEARRTGAPVLALHARAEAPTDADTGPEAPAPAQEPVGVELLIAVPAHPSPGRRPSTSPAGAPPMGVLPAAAGVLALHRLTVRAADLLLLDPIDEGPVLVLSWRVAAEYGSLPQADRLRADLLRALDGSLDIPARLAERERAYARRSRVVLAPPPRVTVAGGSSDTATVIEVRAQDAHGLLHRIGRALETAGVAVRSAHISTLGANAVDAFYVTGEDGAPLTDATAHEVAAAVERALQ
ncbi:[protein-PII] uridylyltransferase [Streptomyces sp. Je 1-4]|uniref:[protein-PII] uridylyltransferase n=1 Tax=Streptomyces TaxID=1883 RepID=UPI00140E9713|nr:MULTISPECIES: [protein-PII] uridylyltransferase [unclassified Streptomyces]QIK06358.1 [protein-PII] uridylyltransferase [Streptomyces sp. ID38640]UYB39706.1 [protein-PII] uridylyltransferase [Streptomyces sp. Je 1-4]UZQ35755.1 [protein-PII] uridylyltransferase [Streptomyces sp. Je 1-4] [Streptomyces sp. Je 1-4 4N24]UZQ43173.1 [protein-PII] uridylyltransferase [Streptomyces sp. Je 1-4] [Streptomyces sp. Je 1-4 4N24_ara]